METLIRKATILGIVGKVAGREVGLVGCWWSVVVRRGVGAIGIGGEGGRLGLSSEVSWRVGWKTSRDDLAGMQAGRRKVLGKLHGAARLLPITLYSKSAMAAASG